MWEPEVGKNGPLHALNPEPSWARLAVCRASILLCFACRDLYRGPWSMEGLDGGIRAPTEQNNGGKPCKLLLRCEQVRNSDSEAQPWKLFWKLSLPEGRHFHFLTDLLELGDSPGLASVHMNHLLRQAEQSRPFFLVLPRDWCCDARGEQTRLAPFWCWLRRGHGNPQGQSGARAAPAWPPCSLVLPVQWGPWGPNFGPPARAPGVCPILEYGAGLFLHSSEVT